MTQVPRGLLCLTTCVFQGMVCHTMMVCLVYGACLFSLTLSASCGCTCHLGASWSLCRLQS